MDILSGLANILGQASTQGGQQQEGMGDLGGLGGLLKMLGNGSPKEPGSMAATAGVTDPLAGLTGLIGALFSNKGGRGAASGLGSLGGLGQLLGSLMSKNGGGMLSQLLGASQPPPAPMAGKQEDDTRAVNLLRALVYAAKADGEIDEQEKTMLTRQIKDSGIGAQAQQYVNQFLSEDLDPNKIARNITAPEEALQIYALSCAITKVDKPMERQYLTSLAQALGIPENARTAIEHKVAS